MSSVTFADLIEVYRATRFDGDGEGVLAIGSEHVAATLRAIIDSNELYDDTQIAVDGDVEPTVGSEVRISVGRPNVKKMGLLVSSFDELFQSPGAVLDEPERYYVKDLGYASGDEPAPDVLLRYRAVLTVLSILRDTASMVDETMRELIFIGKEKVVVPIQFGIRDLGGDVVGKAERLRKLFKDQLHIDEKRTILQTTLIEMVGALRAPIRFGFVVRNLERLADEVEKGYRLFTSSFSYSKIRDDVETARIEFVGKIHKTIVDIQGQLLGIPVATIVVVSQLKKVTGCDATFWTNVGVLLGAWIFVIMLAIAGWNQWKTLTVIGEEVDRQTKRLADDFAVVSGDFADIFKDLKDRIRHHRGVLISIGGVLVIGAAITTIAFFKLLPHGSGACVAAWH